MGRSFGRVRSSSARANAVNLTDGLDGLAAGSSTFAFSALAVIGFWQFRHGGFYHVPHSATPSTWPSSRPAWSGLRRLPVVERGPGPDLHGRHRLARHRRRPWPPSAWSDNVDLLLPIIGGLFVIETLSVIIQVASFRLFHRRVFRMAPIHHHFELVGGRRPRSSCASGSSPACSRRSPSGSSTPTSLARRGRLMTQVPARVRSCSASASPAEAVARQLLRRGHDVVASSTTAPARRRAAAPNGSAVRPGRGPRRSASWTALVDACRRRAAEPRRTGPPPASSAWRPRPASRCGASSSWPRAAGRTVPLVAITGTNGKTTVTTLVTDMLQRSGAATVAAGNIERPARRRSSTATSRWSWSRRRRSAAVHRPASVPASARWLNLAEDHLDWHPTMADYIAAKARIWANQRRRRRRGRQRRRPAWCAAVAAGVAGTRCSGSPSLVPTPSGTGPGRALVGPGEAVRRRRPPCPAACPTTWPTPWPPRPRAVAAGADLPVLRGRTRRVRGAPPPGRPWSASLAGCGGTTTPRRPRRRRCWRRCRASSSVVLIAGGRNKGLDLSVLARHRAARARRRRHRRGGGRGRGRVRRHRRRRSSLPASMAEAVDSRRPPGPARRRRAAVARVRLVRLVPRLRRARRRLRRASCFANRGPRPLPPSRGVRTE